MQTFEGAFTVRKCGLPVGLAWAKKIRHGLKLFCFASQHKRQLFASKLIWRAQQYDERSWPLKSQMCEHMGRTRI